MFCKFCHSEKILVKRVVLSPIKGNKYNLYKCHNCNSYFFNEKDHKVNLDLFYDTLAQDRQSYTDSFSPTKTWRHQQRIIVSLLRRDPVSILDIGCRTGDFLMHFDNNIHRIGVEISNHSAEIARKRGLTIINDALENLDITEQYEVVTCYAILEHLTDPLAFLNSLQNLVKSRGLLVIMIPSIHTLKANWLKNKWHMLIPPEHLNFFSSYFIDNYLQEKKFERVKRYYSSGGMLNYTGHNKYIMKTEALITQWMDSSFVNKLPILDHMYSYYLKK